MTWHNCTICARETPARTGQTELSNKKLKTLGITPARTGQTNRLSSVSNKTIE